MSERKRRTTKSERLRKKRKEKMLRVTIITLCIAFIVGIGVYTMDKFIASQYQVGEEVPEDIRTADELKDDVINILVCGIDWEEDRSGGNTDVIMYVTLDVKGKKVSAFQIPRDTYIGDDVYTGGSGKINGVYWNGKEKDKIMNLIKVINSKLGLSVDHYVTLDMDAFIAMVDGIDGGLEMYVPYEVELIDKNTGKKETIIKEPGWYTLDGYTTSQIIRNRNYPNSDTQRLEVQGYFYAALVKYFTENLNTSDFIKVMSRFTQYITTDMHWTKMASLAQFGFSVPYENMYLIKPPLHGYDVIKEGKTDKTNILVCESSKWADLLNEYCRPYQEPVSASTLKIPNTPPAGVIERDYGVTALSIQTIGDIMNKSPSN